MSERRPLTSTYRLQLHAGFGFAAAADVVDYLADLGVSHLYLSPVLQAAPGSMHGYDVVDHGRVSADLGGEDALVALADRAHEHGLGIVVDVVPNHMAVPTPLSLNRPLWSTLRDGDRSPYAHWFDIDWAFGEGRIGLPVLGGTLAETLAAGELDLDVVDREPVVRYHDQVFPIWAGTEVGRVEQVLERQCYRLASWRETDAVLGYRRFFDVDTLIALRVELPDVFEATHRVLLDLYGRRIVDGFRIDHPDGLADPEGYLARLRDATDGAWVTVEKILIGAERLPSSWAAAGTTGYDATNAVQAALAPPTGAALDALWREVAGPDMAELPVVEHEAKTLVVRELLAPEVERLTRAATAAAAARGTPVVASTLRAALVALLGHVEAYRAYLRLDEPPDAAAGARLAAQVAAAREDRPDLAEPLAMLGGLLVDTSSPDAATRDLVVRFQQVCGPVMAKAVEDTAFYRWHRLVALNEVGGDPRTLDDPDRPWLDDWADYQATHHPLGLTTLSTHDTKRDENVRARLLAAAEQVERWRHVWSLARNLADRHGVDHATAYLVFQTVVGAWPISTDRLLPYVEKATREAKQHTTWTDPDVSYERRVAALATDCLSESPFADAVAAWVHDLEPAAQAIRLTSKLLQLAAPGVPDVYQGTELTDGFLVDPDNRRPVDYTRRRALLLSSDAVGGPGGVKLRVTAALLRLRRDRPELFGPSAPYEPLATTTPHAIGFVRRGRLAVAGTRWPTTLAGTGWADSTIRLPDGTWADQLSDRSYDGGLVGCSDLYAALPVALLVRGTA